MTPVQQKVAAAKREIIQGMILHIRALPLGSEREFLADTRNPAAGESYLRRALEALMDFGRHLLARGFGMPVVEYKAIPRALRERGVISPGAEEKMLMMAGYRNRMVHFYDEVTPSELYGILTERIDDLEELSDEMSRWMTDHPELVDTRL